MESELKKQGFFRELISDFGVMAAMLRDSFKKRCPVTPGWTLFGIAVALVYIFNPFDIVPDAIPFFGAVDDAAVAALELALIRKDLRKYRKWREEQRSDK